VAEVPPFATELEDEDARQEVEAKRADDPALRSRLEQVMAKLPRPPRQPPEPAAQADDGVAPGAPTAFHVLDVVKKLLRGEI